mmetsp:Transcript_52506/g.122880  ORF Transcript_52506/g.122880 Transcript_52506/m.122880 type:complete len:244 (+) Transcript_52506:675-1406(+)
MASHLLRNSLNSGRFPLASLVVSAAAASMSASVMAWNPVGSSTSFLFEFRGVNALRPDTDGSFCMMLVFSFSASGARRALFIRMVNSWFFLRSLLSNSLSSQSSTMKRAFSRMPLATSLPPSMICSSRHRFIFQLLSVMSLIAAALARFSRASKRASALRTLRHSFCEPSKIFQHGGKISSLALSSLSVRTAKLCNRLFGAFHFSLDNASCTICSTSDLGLVIMLTGVRLLIRDPSAPGAIVF